MKFLIAHPPQRKELKEFAYIMGLMSILIFGILFPWLFDYQAKEWLFQIQDWKTPKWPWIIATVFWMTGLIMPLVLIPIYKIWMLIGGVLGWVNTRIILGIVFYAIVFPMGLFMKLLGKDAMKRCYDHKKTSYREVIPSSNINNIEKPY